MQIGFIGLGLMGRPMALNLSKAGHTLHLWARRPASLDPFKAVDATVHASPAEVAKNAEIVFTIVADAPDVQAVAPVSYTHLDVYKRQPWRHLHQFLPRSWRLGRRPQRRRR